MCNHTFLLNKTNKDKRMVIQVIEIYKDIGIGIISLIIIYSFAKWTSDRAFKEVEVANKRVEESQRRFTTFLESSYKENIKMMSEIVSSIKEHIRIKDEALEMLKEQQEMLRDRRTVPKDYKKY